MRALLTPLALLGAIAALSAERPFAVAPAGDACSLLTAAQVSSAIGATVSDGKPLTSRVCVWRDASGKTSKKVTLTMLTPNQYQMGKTPLTGTQKPAVSGVGDEAYYKYFDEPRYEKIMLVDLDVKRGSTMFGIEVAGVGVDDAKAMTKTLALEIVSHL